MVASPDLLTSRHNQWLKDFRLALRGGTPTARGYIGVEGMHLAEEALRARLPVDAVLVSATGEKYLDHLRANLDGTLGEAVRVLRTSDRLFASVAGTDSPQGIAALVKPRATSFDDLVRSPANGAPLILTLVGVQDPGNVGTILRASEAFGATGVATCAGTANPHSPKALRASAGSALRLPILHGVGPSILLTQLRVARIKIYAASATAASQGPPPLFSPWDADWKDSVAVLIGNEGAGLPRDIELSADALLRIPLSRNVESLNAAMAATVLLYEAHRQRSAS